MELPFFYVMSHREHKTVLGIYFKVSLVSYWWKLDSFIYLFIVKVDDKEVEDEKKEEEEEEEKQE